MLQTKKIFVITILVFLVFFVSKQLLFFKKGSLDYIAYNTVYPAIWLSNKITQPVKNFLHNRKEYKNIIEKYETQKETIDELLSENIKLKASLNYQETAKVLAEFQQRYKVQDSIFSKILVKNITETEQYFLINRGKKDHVKKDMIAIYKNQLIGRVIDVFKNYSKILLITDPNSKIAAYTNKTKSTGIVKGFNDINHCQLCYVSHLSKIEKNDLVISSGQGLIYPEGFSLGKIVKHDKKNLYHNIIIKPLTDLKNINFCLLIKQSKIKAF